MERRQHVRVPMQLVAELELPQGHLIRLRSVNFSLVGALLENVPVEARFLGCQAPLRLILHGDVEDRPELPPYVIEFQALIVRQGNDGTGVKLVGIDIERFKAFQKLLLRHAENPKQVLEEIRQNALLSADTVDTSLLKEQMAQFVEQGVRNIFDNMMTLRPVLERTIVHPDLEVHDGPSPEVAALVGFNGAIEGGVILVCSRAMAVHLAADLAGEAFTEFSADAKDAFGELANMMAGEVQTGLSVSCEQINLTPPTIISGTHFRLEHRRELHRIFQFFRLGVDFFAVECFFS